jgi:hypothetical protein
MLESRQYSTEEIARAFRCPPALLGVTTPGAMSYASVEMNGIHFVTYCLRPYIVKIEDAYSNLIPGDGFLKINVDGLLRGDQQSRYASFSTGIQSGFLSINDIHRLEDMPPAEGGDVYRVPLANVDLAAANLTELEKKTCDRGEARTGWLRSVLRRWRRSAWTRCRILACRPCSCKVSLRSIRKIRRQPIRWHRERHHSEA